MYTPVDIVEVRLWKRRVGALALDPRLGCYAFEYAPGFLQSGIELAPIFMPLRQARAPFAFPSLAERTFWRLPALVADALPDDFGNSLIDAWMASQGVEKAAITSLDRLAYMGSRAVGALEFKPARGPKKLSTAIELSALVESARRAVQGDFGTDEHAMAALAQVIQVGTSAGGARAKAAIAWNPGTTEIRAGHFEAPEGFEHWLLKFDGMGADKELGAGEDYGRIEYAYYLMARAAGITISKSRLLEENGRAHFMTRRFDRAGNQKHHVQTLCAIAHLDYRQKATHDVSQWFQTIDTLGLGYEAREEALRRSAFNVMAANCDDHTKNISFLLREGGGWELAPAYDMTHAHNSQGEWTFQHLMSVNRKFTGIERADLLAVAEDFGIGTASRVLDQVGEAVARWPGFASDAGVGKRAKERVQKHIKAL